MPFRFRKPTKPFASLTGDLIAIGDIHGCAATLKDLIAALRPTDNDRLVFLGDYIDRGPDSKSVIDYLLELNAAHDCIFLMGNHELMMLDAISFGDTNWSHNGCEPTLESYLNERGQVHIPQSHLDFLESCFYYYDTPEFFFVHGGLRPSLTIEENLSIAHAQDFVWERKHLGEAWMNAQRHAWTKTVVCGHTPQPRPLITEKVICIDTGCVYDFKPNMGKLTAIRLPSKHIVQMANHESTVETQHLASL
jgi:serine/threonine protein phosphatase 1